ncbi:MAG: hypothetical protein ACTSR8_22095 [Promethearchaeota archaeon]
MERNKRIILVGIGIGLLFLSAIFLVLLSPKTGYEVYVNSLEEKEISTITLNAGDILIIQSEGIDDASSIIKIYNSNDELLASSQSELKEGISMMFTAEESGEHKIIVLLDNPDAEVDGIINISISYYATIYFILLGCLFIFASIMVIASSLLREQFIIPSGAMVDKLKKHGLKPEKQALQKPEDISKEEIVSKYKGLIEPVSMEIVMSFISKIYKGIAERTDIMDAYAIDLRTEEIIWVRSNQAGKSQLSFLEKPIPLESNKGIHTIFNKMVALYGGSFPSQIVLSFPNYYLNAMVHKQIMVIILLKPDVDWGISSSIFKK